MKSLEKPYVVKLAGTHEARVTLGTYREVKPYQGEPGKARLLIL
jgi:hypothetical protein